ncbi:hypothetical protein EDD86DRAFT_266688, partial [Gorgonomyces haynaldii]
MSKLHVAIVGAGPGGFYTAQQLLKTNRCTVSFFERLPVPFGLARFGVSPTHPDVKNCTHKFQEILLNEDCKFYGNVQVGRDISISKLLESFNATVLAYGSNGERSLGIPGQDAGNVFTSRQIVGWYNGHPDHQHIQPDFSVDTCAIIGQGNVALDIARILMLPMEELSKTDITHSAIKALEKSTIKNIHLIGRRGPVQAAFTAKELRELLSIPSAQFQIDTELLQHEINREALFLKTNRQRKRLMDILSKGQQIVSNPTHNWSLDFLQSPKEILQSDGQAHELILTKNRLEGKMPSVKAVATDETVKMEAQLIISSIGYKNQPIPGVTFDPTNQFVENNQGKTNTPGLYVSGWLKHGPQGVIASTMYDAFETARYIPDLKATTLQDWIKIDEEEIRRGLVIGKPREKMTALQEML